MSTDSTYTGAGTATPPAVVLCTTGRVAWTAPTAAQLNGTGLPVSGAAMPFRLRGHIAAGTTTGVFSGATVRPSVESEPLEGTAVAGVATPRTSTALHTSSTPGDLPPEDPLS